MSAPYRAIPREVLIHGQLAGIDFDEKLIEFRFEADLPPLAKGRYAILPANDLHMLVMRLRAAEARDA